MSLLKLALRLFKNIPARAIHAHRTSNFRCMADSAEISCAGSNNILACSCMGSKLQKVNSLFCVCVVSQCEEQCGINSICTTQGGAFWDSPAVSLTCSCQQGFVASGPGPVSTDNPCICMRLPWLVHHCYHWCILQARRERIFLAATVFTVRKARFRTQSMRHQLPRARNALLGHTPALLGPRLQRSVNNAVRAHILTSLEQFLWQTALVAMPAHILLCLGLLNYGLVSTAAQVHGHRPDPLLAFTVLPGHIPAYLAQAQAQNV